MWWKRHILLFFLGWGTLGLAHPVSFKGGWSFMAFNQRDMLDWQVLYSFERNLSLGVDFIRDNMEGPDRYFLLPRISWLIHRWNAKDSQANIYVYGGAGAATKDGLTKFAAEGAIEADYETRKIYLSGKGTWVGADSFDPLHVYQLRLGFAPYLAEFDDVHSWLIAQAQYFPYASEEKLRVGPVLRVFYKSVLWEMGVSAQGSWNLNFMVHW